ncbi:MAG: FkbM family methyltransferase [Cyclobacteriaceae bacterium]|jgi:FkbM family methyltransferase
MIKGSLRSFKNWVTNILSYIQLIPILSTIKKGDVVIDCGANVGVVTGYFASKAAKVYSFEPDPNAFNRLNSKFAKNENVECINKGVWKEKSRMKLYFHAESTEADISWSVGSSVIKEKGNVNSENYVEIDLIDLAEFIDELKTQVKVLKIDIEGAEIEVLNKLIDTDRFRKVDHILVETHETKIAGQKPELKKLRNRIKTEGIKNINLNWL